MKTARDIFFRICAVFIIASLATIGAASIFGVNAVTAASIAGLLAVVDVVGELARFYVADGKLSKKEIDDAFAKATKSDKGNQ